MKNKSWFLLAVFSISCFTKIAAQSADLILTNGKIFTSDTAQLFVQALAIKGNKIMAVGSSAAITKLATRKTKRIDLKGKTVVPGFNDAHDHLGWFPSVGLRFSHPEYNPVGLSKSAVLDSIARLVKMAKPNQWISGLIGTQILFDKSMRAALDSLAPANPVALQIWWGHGLVVNSKALEMSGLSDNDKDPLGGWYVRDPSSNKINAIHENAQVPVWNAWIGADYENLLNELHSYSQMELQAGITTVQLMSSTFNATQSKRFLETANLSQRIRVIAWPRTTAAGRQLAEWNLNNNSPKSLLYYSGIKYMLDGSPLEQHSFNKKPYQYGHNGYGQLNYPVDTIRKILQESLQSNRQLMLHITGDSSLAIVLSQMKQLAGNEVWKNKRVRIEHNSTPNITEQEVNDLKALGLLMMHTPVYCQTSRMRSFIDKGIAVGISPDGTTNPFWNILIITTQQSNPKENLTREQAVIAYTRTNSFAEFLENEKGTLMKNMLADLAVLSQDIFTIPNEQLSATRSVLTIVNGKIVHQELELEK